MRLCWVIRSKDNTLLFNVSSEAIPRVVLQHFGCVTAMGVENAPPITRYCVPDDTDSILISTIATRNSESCCQECLHTNPCTACSYANGACNLLRDPQDSDARHLPTIVAAQNRVNVVSRAGCECQRTFVAATSSFATCFKGSTVDGGDYRCSIDPSSSCIVGDPDTTHDLCNGACAPSCFILATDDTAAKR